MRYLLQKLSIIVFLATISKPVIAQDVLTGYTYLGMKSKIELFFLFGQAVDYEVKMYKLNYKTLDPQMNPDTASGLLVVPIVPANTALPIVVYAHGTTDGPTDVPSNLRGGYEIALAYAAFGFATLAPDFLGLGDARGFHPYVHAATEASASLDILFAGYEYLEFNDPDFDPNFLFLAGYSQGGHVSMALHKEIDDYWSVIIPVTAATHMSGPYSISGVMRDKILSDEPYGTPSYIAYVVMGYQEVYGDLYNDLTDLFKEPYASQIDSFYNGIIGLSDLNEKLLASLAAEEGSTVNKLMFHDSIINLIVTQPDHPINVALRQNDTYNWAPDAPTRLYYCGADEQVPFENSLVAEAEMQALGATDVQALNMGPNLTHGGCVIPAVTSSIAFFQSFLGPSSINNLDRNAEVLQVYPNPAHDEIFIAWEPAIGGMEFEIINTNGITIKTGHSKSNRLYVDDLTSGIYMIICTAKGETRIARLVHP